MSTGLKKWRDGISPWAAEKGHADSGKEVYTIAGLSAERGTPTAMKVWRTVVGPSEAVRRYADRVEEVAYRHGPVDGRGPF